MHRYLPLFDQIILTDKKNAHVKPIIVLCSWQLIDSSFIYKHNKGLLHEPSEKWQQVKGSLSLFGTGSNVSLLIHATDSNSEAQSAYNMAADP